MSIVFKAEHEQAIKELKAKVRGLVANHCVNWVDAGAVDELTNETLKLFAETFKPDLLISAKKQLFQQRLEKANKELHNFQRDWFKFYTRGSWTIDEENACWFIAVWDAKKVPTDEAADYLLRVEFELVTAGVLETKLLPTYYKAIKE